MDKLVSINTSDLTLNIGSLSALREFIEREKKHWGWVLNIQDGVAGHAQELWRGNIQAIDRLLESVDKPSEALKHREQIEEILGALFGVGRIPPSDTVAGRSLLDFQKQFPHDASAALAAYTGRLPAFNRHAPFSVYGATVGASLRWGVATMMAERYPAQLQDALKEATSVVSEAQTVSQRANELSEDTIKRLDRFTKLVTRKLRHRSRSFSEKRESVIAEGKAEFDVVTNTYREQMKLKAPVEYWAEKAKDHKESSDTVRGLLLAYTAIVAIILIIALFCVPYLSTSTLSDTSFYVRVGITAALSTIVFWVGRVLTRLYLSQIHLNIDAEERATMVKTYLALTNEDKVSAEDRNLVLSGIFRTTADGIVKDDAAPDITVGTLISKAVSR